MKKSILLLSVLSVLTFNAASQFDPVFTTDGFSPFWNNPAATGSFNKFSATAIFRNQWPAIPGNFNTYGFNVEADTKFGSKSKGKQLHMPIGINAIFQKQGAYSLQLVNIPICIPIELKQSTLAIGISAGIKKVEYDWIQFGLVSNPPITRATIFDLNGGIFWSGDNYYVGASVTNITGQTALNSEIDRHFYFQAGYRFKVGQHHIYPMINAASEGGFNSLRAMSYFQFKDDVFSIAAGISQSGSFIYGGTVSLKQFKLAYLYDITTSALSDASAGSHEFRLSYAIAK